MLIETVIQSMLQAVQPSNDVTTYMHPEEFAAEAEQRPVEHFFDHYMDTPCHDLLARRCWLVRRAYDDGRECPYVLITPDGQATCHSPHPMFRCCVVSMRTARIQLENSVADAISWQGITNGSYATCTGNVSRLQGRQPAPSKIQVYLHQRIPSYYARAYGNEHVPTFPYDTNFQILDKYVGLAEFARRMQQAFLAGFSDDTDDTEDTNDV